MFIFTLCLSITVYGWHWCELLSKSRASLVTAKETPLIHLVLLSDTRFWLVILFAAIQASELGTSLRFVLPLLSSLLVQWSLTMTSLNFCSIYSLCFLNSMGSALDYCCKEYNPKGWSRRNSENTVLCDCSVNDTLNCHSAPGTLYIAAVGYRRHRSNADVLLSRNPVQRENGKVGPDDFWKSFPPWSVRDCSVPVLPVMLWPSRVCPRGGTKSLMLMKTSSGLPVSSLQSRPAIATSDSEGEWLNWTRCALPSSLSPFCLTKQSSVKAKPLWFTFQA